MTDGLHLLAMMNTLRIRHPADDEQKLKSVKAEMQKIGPPVIRVVRYPDYYMAIEGCHRLTVAAQLRFAPVLVVLTRNTLVEVASLDRDIVGDAQFVRAGAVADIFYSARFNQIFVLNSDGTLSMQAPPVKEPEGRK
jgi:uncharacterized ParB-like nuclease family protein